MTNTASNKKIYLLLYKTIQTFKNYMQIFLKLVILFWLWKITKIITKSWKRSSNSKKYLSNVASYLIIFSFFIGFINTCRNNRPLKTFIISIRLKIKMSLTLLTLNVKEFPAFFFFLFLRHCLKLSLSKWKVHMTTGLQVPNEKPSQPAWVGGLDWQPVTVINFTNRPAWRSV